MLTKILLRVLCNKILYNDNTVPTNYYTNVYEYGLEKFCNVVYLTDVISCNMLKYVEKLIQSWN